MKIIIKKNEIKNDFQIKRIKNNGEIIFYENSR
jgi:hypothetical protein